MLILLPPAPTQEIFPGADVQAEGNNTSLVKVTANVSGKDVPVISVAQRDLYRKYRWPAEPKMKQFLEAFKEEYNS